METLKPDGPASLAKGETARLLKVDTTCTRAWGGGQTCEAAAVTPKRKHR